MKKRSFKLANESPGMQDAFRKMVVADVIGEATEEEQAYLRSDDNLEAWREELAAYLNDLYAESKRRKAAYHRLHNQTDNWAEINDFSAEYLAFSARVDEIKVMIFRRLGEAKQLQKDLKARRHEEHQRRMAEKVRNDHAGRRSAYRKALEDVERVLDVPEFFSPTGEPIRLRLLTQIRDVLWGAKGGPEEAA
jgi:hypothetical protein